MEVRNCKGCGKLFNYMEGDKPLCAACQRKLEQKFSEVRTYIEEHPQTTIQQVSEEKDVSVKQIKQWIRQERLVLSQASADGILCEHCGIPIRSGRFCEKCKTAMQNTFANAIEKPKAAVAKKEERDGNKMRFLQ